MERRRFLELGLAALPLAGCGAALRSPHRPLAVPASGQRARLRDLGVTVGSLPPAPLNAITDVPGVRVGQVTLISGSGPLVVGQGPVRTGVTAVLPHGGILSREPVMAAEFTLNGNGELTGVGFLRRSGQLGAPVLFTDTGSVGAAYTGALARMLEVDPDLCSRGPYPEPVVGETWADFLHDTAGRHLKPEHAVQAMAQARGEAVAEGCVGGGTGMRAFQFKAGIGTASRSVEAGTDTFTVGVLVQANFGRRPQLVVQGVPVGHAIPDLLPARGEAEGGSSLLVAIATDAPLIPVQLQRLCKRAALGMARTGGVSTHGSGDLCIAFSTARWSGAGTVRQGAVLADRRISALHQAVVEATEEAILNSLTAAVTMSGRDGNTIYALPLDRLVAVLRAHGVVK